MADPATSPEKNAEPNSQPPGPDNPTSISDQHGQLPPPPSSASSSSTPPSTTAPSSNTSPVAPPAPLISQQIPPSIPLYAPPPPHASAVHPSAPSFRPAVPTVPLPTPPQFSLLPNANFHAQNPGVQPPGVAPIAVSGIGSVGTPLVPQYAPPGQLSNPAMRPYAQMLNGYQAMPPPAGQGIMPPPVS